MIRWKKHACLILVALIGLQIFFLFTWTILPSIRDQLIILTMTSNILALVYAIWGFKTFEEEKANLSKNLKAYGFKTPDEMFLSFAIKYGLVKKKAWHKQQNKWVDVE